MKIAAMPNFTKVFAGRGSDRTQAYDNPEVDDHRGRKRQSELAGALPYGQKGAPE